MTFIDDRYQHQLDDIVKEGLFKDERMILTPQGVEIDTDKSAEVLNFCANNYLGLANHPEIIEAAVEALRSHGFGMASVRFICGTQDVHKKLEQSIADFLHTEDAILYTSCFDANTGLFETLLGADDAVISDSLNHASIIDGIRLCKAKRLRYDHGDMDHLEAQLKASMEARTRLIATDGVFSMDGDIAKLDDIVPLAERYDAMLMVDDSHATGVIGEGGRGAAAYHGLMDKVDIYTSTLGKALGGGSGGFTASRRDIITLLRQRSRPYLFSNTLAPALAAAGVKAFELISSSAQLLQTLHANTQYFREHISAAGFDVKPGQHPIVPIMLYDADIAQRMANALLVHGVYVIAFSYPVVPKGEARIRVQISAAHQRRHLDRALEAFISIGKELNLI